MVSSQTSASLSWSATTDAHETNDNTTMRQVVVFRLFPKSEILIELPRLRFTPEPRPTVEVVAVEEQHTERAYVTPDREPYEAELPLVGSTPSASATRCRAASSCPARHLA